MIFYIKINIYLFTIYLLYNICYYIEYCNRDIIIKTINIFDLYIILYYRL